MVTRNSLDLILACAILLPVDIIAVSLRLWAKRIKKQRWGADDLLAVLALICIMVMNPLYIWAAIHAGIGQHTKDIPPDTRTKFYKFVFAIQFPYYISITLIKLSILTFYLRLFSVQPFMNIVRGVMVFNVCWCITFCFTNLLQEIPITDRFKGYTNPKDVEPHNHNYIAAATLNMLSDIVTVTLPMFVIWRLKITRSEKFLLTGIFTLGIFVCVASAVRLYYHIIQLVPQKTHDLSYIISGIAVWSALEPCFGLICTCLPFIRPVTRAISFGPITTSVRKLLSGHFSSQKSDGSHLATGIPLDNVSAKSDMEVLRPKAATYPSNEAVISIDDERELGGKTNFR